MGAPLSDVDVDPDASSADPSAGSRWRRALSSDWAKTFGMIIAFHVVLTAVAILFQSSYPIHVGYPVDTLGKEPTLLSHTFRWDSPYYNGILNGQYSDPDALGTPAFYPLFPLTVGLVQMLTFNSITFLWAGLLVNIIASWLAATALLKIARLFVTSTWAPWLAVVAFLTAPTAYFMHGFYTESVFCALGFWAYLFALRRDWTWMGVCLIPLTETRITALLFIGLCLLEFCRAHDWKIRGILNWNLLWFPVSFVGFEAFSLYLKVVKGDALAMFHAYALAKSWPYHVFNPDFPGTLGKEVDASVTALVTSAPDSWDVVSHILPMVALLVLLIASGYVYYVYRGEGVPLAGFGIASIVMFTLNSNVVSVHRYALPCAVIYIAMATAAERSTRLKPVIYGMILSHTLLMAFLYSLFIAGSWSG
jgi:hypothetical protein